MCLGLGLFVNGLWFRAEVWFSLAAGICCGLGLIWLAGIFWLILSGGRVLRVQDVTDFNPAHHQTNIPMIQLIISHELPALRGIMFPHPAVHDSQIRLVHKHLNTV